MKLTAPEITVTIAERARWPQKGSGVMREVGGHLEAQMCSVSGLS